MKSKYNPFKMWGSWVGAVVSGIIPFHFISATVTTSGFKIIYIFFKGLINGQTNIIGLVFGLIIIIIGFLIGWGIHSLVRKFK